MIHVDHASVGQPGTFTVGDIANARRRAAEFFGRNRRVRLQESFDFPPLWDDTRVRVALDRVFGAKCALCETPANEAEGGCRADQFRPRSGAVGQDGTVDPDHYWWLAYEWRNLYLVCATCSRNKGNRFPVRGPRAKPESDWPEVDRERRLLVDPCADQPNEDLAVHPDGVISGLTEAGKATVDILSLNRSELVRGRQREYDAAQSFARDLGPTAYAVPDRLDSRLLDYLAPGEHFVAAREQAIRDLRAWDQQATAAKPPLNTPDIAKSAEGSGFVQSGEALKSRAEMEASQRESEKYSLADENASPRSYFKTSRTIERIELRNFRLIKDMTLEFPKHEGGWLMLLGENATGKSTILQAIALTLMGEDYRQQMATRLGLDASRYVRHGATSGLVRIWLNGLTDPVELRVRRGSSTFEGSPPEPKTLVVAYGATRLLPRHGFEPAHAPKYADVENIFNPFEPLGDATGWLIGLRPGRYQEAARALKTLLPIGPEDRLIRRSTASSPADRIRARFGGVTTSLDELSDGYQSVVALAADAIRVMQDYWTSMDSAEGIIVIDELGAHMHPRWKMQLVARLRMLFPRVQFIATTHDPLCLRGLRSGEVAVLRRIEDQGVFAVTDLPPVEGLRADQLLTSEHFGLSSTLDPETEQLFDRYYALKAKNHRTSPEQKELDGLELEFQRRNVLGKDRRERLMLEVIDQYLADVRDEGDPEKRERWRAKAIENAEELYATVPPAPLDATITLTPPDEAQLRRPPEPT